MTGPQKGEGSYRLRCRDGSSGGSRVTKKNLFFALFLAVILVGCNSSEASNEEKIMAELRQQMELAEREVAEAVEKMRDERGNASEEVRRKIEDARREMEDIRVNVKNQISEYMYNVVKIIAKCRVIEYQVKYH